MRLLILKLTATLSLWLCGCSIPAINVEPKQQTTPQQVELKITVDGTGKINVAGGADVNVKTASQPNSLPVAGACVCGCSQEDCRCSRGRASAAPTQSTSAGSAPQNVLQCRDGVCRLVSVSSANVRVFVQYGNPASDAMRRALKYVNGIEFVTGTPPAINGLLWWPTAVDQRGRLWSPINGWHDQSRAEFERWRGGM